MRQKTFLILKSNNYNEDDDKFNLIYMVVDGVIIHKDVQTCNSEHDDFEK